jgi:superkiller protein 3
VALGEKTVALGEKETALEAAKTNELQAKAAQKDAQENLKDALAAVEQMLTRVAEDKLAYVPQMETIRRDLLLDALKFYQKFLEKQSDDPVIRREAALAYRRVGRIHHHLSQHKDAERAYRNAFLMFDKLDASALADPALLQEMVNCHIEFSWPLYHLGKGEESLQNIRRAAELADKLDKKAPGNRPFILNARNNLASILVSQDPHEAEKILKENLALADAAVNLEGVHRGLAHVFVATGRLPQAEQAFRQALKYAEQMAKENPSADWVQAALANDQRALALAIWIGRPQEADEIQRRAVLIFDKLASDFPNVPQYSNDLAVTLHEHAGLLKHLGQTVDAEKTYRRAVAVYEKLATDFPTMPAYWQSTFDLRLTLGQFLKEAGKIKEASGVYRDADAIVSKLSTDVPGRLAHWVALTRAHCELGRMLSHAGKKEEAEAAFRRVVTLSEKLEADFAGKPEHRRELAHSHTIAAEELAEARLHADADRLYGWALQHRAALVRDDPQAKQSQEELAFLHASLGGHHLWRTRRLKDAERSYQTALEIFEKLALEFPDMPAYRARVAECRIRLGSVAQGEGRIQQAEQNFRQGIQLAEKVAKELPNDTGLRLHIGNGYRWLSVVLRDTGSPQEVEKSLVRSLAVLDKVVAEFPNSDWALGELSSTCRKLGEHHFKSGRTEEGRRFDQRAVELSEQVQANNIAPYRKAVEIAPNDAPARYNLGAALQRQKKLDEAAAAYRKATELDPKAVNAHDALGLVLRMQRKLDAAAAVYRRVIELEPNQANWHSNLGDVLREQKKFDEAIAAYRKALALDPKSAYGSLAAALVAGGRGAEAIPLIDEYVRRAESEGRRPIGLIVLRFRHFEKGKDASGCRATAEIWERLKPTDVLDFYNAACFRAATAAVLRAADGSAKAAESATAEADRAMHWLGKAVGAGYTSAGYIKDDKDLDALRDREDFNKLVAALARAGVASAEKALAEAPKDANRWHSLGQRRYDAGDYEGAVTALQKYHELTGGEEEWTNPFWLAKAHWRLGNTDEAKRWYDSGARWMEARSGRATATMIRIRNETAELLKTEPAPKKQELKK